MSRIGNRIITVPEGVAIEIEKPNTVTIKGPKGTLTRQFSPKLAIKVEGSELTVKRPNDMKEIKMLHGTTTALLNNMVVGVTEGYEIGLEIIGVGYRANLQGNTLNLNVGYSHPIRYTAEEGITLEVPSQTEIVVKGIDKERVGEVAANIRKFRKPEPYKGKGIRYKGEYVPRKEGKTAGKK